MTTALARVSLRLPAGWFELPVAPFDRDRHINRLVRDQLGHSREGAPLRRQIHQTLRSQLQQAWEAGAVLSAALVASHPGGVPPALVGSLTVVLRRAAPDLTPAAIAAQWGAEQGERVVTLDLPSGPATKVVRRTEHRPENWTVPVEGVLMQYFLRCQDTLVVVHGYTINADLEVAFESLFDAVVSSLDVLP
jgi:hypothetical protein